MSYLALLGLFLLFLLLGPLFFPVLSGCLTLFFFLFVFGLVIIFFSLNLIWFVIAALVIYCFGIGFKYFKWHKLLDYNQYVMQYPQCKLAQGVCCYSCGSDKTINQGLFNTRSSLRFYLCQTCGTLLFRFKVL
jgi:hypothetical protein